MKYLVSRKKLEANLSQNHITGFVFKRVLQLPMIMKCFS